MAYESSVPTEVPQIGFYYHYKHDPAGAFNNYAYEVVGIGHHTEDDCEERDRFLVVYRPLYEAFVYKNGRMFDVRPLSMFMEEVEKEGKRFPRFAKIADPAVLRQLEELREKMYPPGARG
ncbi:MAG TPA: DUF1653 domain-containing protein [Candidatus Paceibacterota bacterium]|nr:DUF1653 domain-containing protein [Candidatus Paceibacterota bacterium]